MLLEKEMFESVKKDILRMATEYHVETNAALFGVAFYPKKRRMIIITPVFSVDYLGVEFEANWIPKDKTFYNMLTNEFTKIPFPMDIDDILSGVEQPRFIGHTEYPVIDLLDMLTMKETLDEIMKNKTRFVFVQGFLEKGTFPAKFKLIDGRWGIEIKKSNTVFFVDEDSPIPPRAIREDEGYCCVLTPNKTIDVISKFGKTRAGLYISKGVFCPSAIPDINALNPNAVPPFNTLSSNVLEFDESVKDKIMPPIHIDGAIFHDVLKAFLLAKKPVFRLLFQDSGEKFIQMENEPIDDDDVKIIVRIAPLRVFTSEGSFQIR